MVNQQPTGGRRPHDYGEHIFLTQETRRPPPPSGAPGAKLGTNVKGMIWLIFVPWIMFLAMQVPFFTFYHHNPMVAISLVFSGFIVSMVPFMINQRRKVGGAWYLFLGLLCMLACICGTASGLYVYYNYMFQYYSYYERMEYTAVLPSEPASARQDAGKLVFSVDARVDVTRSVGYKANKWYCAAPILDETSGTRVEYWAVGVDCCHSRGDFSCDDAWNWRAKAGLVVLQASKYLPSELTYFKKAIKECEAAYGFVASDEAIAVRWVADPLYMQDQYRANGTARIIGSAVCYFFLSILFGAMCQVFSKRRPT